MDPLIEKGLPSNVEAEKLILGSILLDDSMFVEIAGALKIEDFVLEANRRIWRRMLDLHKEDERIDRITLANCLMNNNELESVGGLSYLISLDENLPRLPTISGYVKIVQDKSALRTIALVGHTLLTRATLANDSPIDLLNSAQAELLRLGERNATTGLRQAGDIMRSVPGGINTFLDPSKRAKGLSTGFTKFDEMTGGLHAGELIILAARPSMGKTAMALNIAYYVTEKLKLPAAIFSLEMSADSLISRMTCSAAYVDSHKFRMGYLNQAERDKLAAAASRIANSPLYIDDTPSLNQLDMHAKLRRLEQQNGIPFSLIIVDYLQLMTGKQRRENRQQEVSDFSRGFKLMAKELNAPMLVLSQLSRAPETRPGNNRPQLSDLRESGAIEQDADVVAFIFRPELYSPDREDLKGLAELLLSKQRNGPIGKIELVYLHSMTKFENRAEDLDGDLNLGE